MARMIALLASALRAAAGAAILAVWISAAFM
ncbi:hypothetical protein GGR16_002634 [Chelatococcus caeni]|uniref:Uncharacterized protein n=1 Tax=Chelatococcus caeni TaxID=1348468 RepID=A0A840BXA5_9HYPH|nr:hypothetical protein [Chelatococcus caeni]